MPLPRIQFPASHMTWPLDMYNKIGEASGFQQPQVVGSWGSGGSDFGSNFAGMFGGMMEQMQQRQAAQQQAQQEANAVQSMVPTLKSMGYDINTINNLFKVSPKAVLEQGMSETAFAHHQQLEIQKQQQLHDQEVQQNMLTPSQLHAVDSYKAGVLSWDDLNQVIPYDKLQKAFELSQKGLDLQKSALLMPLEYQEKRQKDIHDTVINKYLDDQQQAELDERHQRVAASKNAVQNASTRMDLEKANHQLQKDKFAYEKYRDEVLKPNMLNRGRVLKNGFTQDNFKLYNTISALNDGSLDSAQRMFQAARRAGVNAPPPGPLTDGGKYLKIVGALLKNKSLNDSNATITTLQTKKAGVDKQIQNEQGAVNELQGIESKLKDPKTSDAEADKLSSRAGQIGNQVPMMLAGHKVTADEYARYQTFDPEKKKRFINWLTSKGR